MNSELIEEAVKLMERGEPCVLATIIQVKGSAPREAGTQMLITAGGQTLGTIGGGCAEASIRQRALLVLEKGEPEIYHLDLTADTAADEGMVCGGIMEVFLEPLGG
ncbi:XdhC family protein [Moorella sulfitireducens]|uniref:XdhC family protein n=1 Tax=Neomoorella sulfitireducens TaxID=2972948 RepID=UPI0021ACC6ED|nr:XdhC family protein [Moorella sulfitireducens]